MKKRVALIVLGVLLALVILPVLVAQLTLQPVPARATSLRWAEGWEVDGDLLFPTKLGVAECAEQGKPLEDVFRWTTVSDSSPQRKSGGDIAATHAVSGFVVGSSRKASPMESPQAVERITPWPRWGNSSPPC